MKTIYKFKSVWLIVLLLLGSMSSGLSNVIWYGDTNKDYLDSFYRLSKESGESASVWVETQSGHGKVWAVNKPSGSKRAELARTDGWEPSEGETVYIGWKMKVNIAGSSNPSGYAVYQLKSQNNGSQNYPILIGYNGNTLTVSAYRAGSGSQASRKTDLCSKNVAENDWVYIVLGIKFSRDKTKGYTEVWLNGEKQNLTNDNSNKQYYHRTLDDEGNYCKWGAYNENARPFNITTYLDEMRIATSYNEANPYTYEGGSGYSDDIISVSAPSSVEAGSTAHVSVNYSSSTNRDVIVYFQLDHSPWTSYKTVKKDVSAGTGTLNFSIPIPANTPIKNDDYQFQTFITTNGGGWNNKLDNITKNNVDVTSATNNYDDDIISVSAPSSVEAGKSVNVTVNYSSSTHRDVVVNFQLNHSPWTSYATIKKDVSAGSGTLNFSIPIPANTPVKNDDYQFQTYITINGGDWNNKLDNIAKTNIDVTSAATNIEGIYKLRNVATNKYLDSDGTVVKVGSSSSGMDKQWKIVSSSGNYYNIDCEYSGRGVLDTDGNGVVKNNTVESPVTTDDKEWKAISLGGDMYRFENVFSGRGYLSANTSNNVVGYSNSTDNSTKWELVFVSSLKQAKIINNEFNTEDVFSILVYPNPAKSYITIDLSGIEEASVEILNLAGKAIYKTITSQKELNVSLSPKIKSGIYCVKVVDNNNNIHLNKLLIK